MPQQWFETFFRGVAVDVWRAITTPEWTTAEVDFIEQELGLPQGSRILDVPCGHGRHSVELAARGYRTTGIDISDEFLDAARAALPSGDWRHGDMRHLQLEAGAYEAAFCWGNSFGYLAHDDAMAFLRAVQRALKPGGTLLVDVPTVAESILPDFEPSQWHRTGDMFLLGESRYDAAEARLDVEYTFVRGGVVETRPSCSYIFTGAELKRMFAAAGFDVQAMYGSRSREPFDLCARGLIISASRRRRAPDPAHQRQT